MDRICAWTGGHPYLTQRVARGAARKGGRFEDVERVVREQLLAPGAARIGTRCSAHVRAWFGEPSRPSRRAAKLLQKLAAGGKVAEPADAAVAERLWLSGTVRVDRERSSAFATASSRSSWRRGWLKPKSGAPKWLAAAAVLLVALAAGGYWYTQRLPVADIETLTSAAAELDAVEEAYRRLRGLPGFAERADELWLAALDRQSRAATTLAAAVAADTRLRDAAGPRRSRGPLARRVLAAPRPRAGPRGAARCRDLARAARRGFARRGTRPRRPIWPSSSATTTRGSSGRCASRARPSIGTWRSHDAAVVSIDAEQQASAHTVRCRSERRRSGAAPVALTALEHRADARARDRRRGNRGRARVVAGRAARGGGRAARDAGGAERSRGRAPGPAQRRRARRDVSLFQASQGSPLAQLADEGVRGVWRLDRRRPRGRQHRRVRRLGPQLRRQRRARRSARAPSRFPIRTRGETVNVQAVGDRAVAWPISPGVIGTVALWNLATGQLEHDFTLPAAPREVALDPDGRARARRDGRQLMLWNVADGALVARIGTRDRVRAAAGVFGRRRLCRDRRARRRRESPV